MKFHVKMMFSGLLASLVSSASWAALAASPAEMPSRTFHGAATPRVQFKAPGVASAKVSLAALPAEKAAASTVKPNAPLRIGTVRPLAKSSALETWTPVEGGFVARLHAASEEALGLRAKLELTGLAAPIEVRVQGNNDRVEWMKVDASRTEAWTPWTEGSEQMIEVFAPVTPPAGAVRVAAIVHFTESPFAKAAASCTLSTQCSTGDVAMDAAMAERKKSVAKISFIDDGGAFICSGTLLNTERYPAPFFTTANHCVDNASAATSITTLWFYEDSSCALAVPNPGAVQVSSGAELIFTNYNLDGTLLLLNAEPPVGAVYAGWNNTELANGTPVFSISHPKGDTSRWASGVSTDNDGRIQGPVQPFNLVRFTRGLIEGGSSGSGLFTLSNGSLQFRGTLLGHSIGNGPEYSCTNTEEEIIYGRFDIFEAQIDQYIRNSPQAADDAPNRARDLFSVPVADPPLDARNATLELDNRRIDYVGDLDVYRFQLRSPAWVSTWTEGAQDTIGTILDARGVELESNDDWQLGAPYNFGISKFLFPGTYYVQVGHFEPAGTGAYNLRMRADNVDANYTALWWNPAENGWGLNLNHQGNTLFGTLYTYDAAGNGTWFSMSNGAKQPDGSYSGSLASTTGPVFSASPWNPSAVTGTIVGNMRIAFTGDDNGTLTYNVGAATVTKAITKLAFQTPPVCTWSAADRSLEHNFQDLWWGGASESGWGVNLAHQGNIIFATLFTYDAAGQPRWFVMSSGQKTGAATYTGPLYRTTGPAFNSVPFTPITAANNTQVGTMSFTFGTGNSGTMTYTVDGVPVVKNIQRLVFGALKPKCSQSQ